MKKPIITTVSLLLCATAFAQKGLTKAAAERPYGWIKRLFLRPVSW